MSDIICIDKEVLLQIIATLKTLKVDGYDSMERLVNCVTYLEMVMNPPQKGEPEQEEEVDTNG